MLLRLKSAVCCLAALTIVSIAAATNVTFQVDMSVQTTLGNFAPATDNVVVRGEFNGWSGDTHMLTAQGNGIYAGTFDLAPANYQYKFVKLTVANPSGDWESVVNPDHGNNRYVVVGNDPMTLPVVFFSDLTSTGTTDVEINFRVDMTVQILVGNFNPATDWVVIRGGHPSIGGWGGLTRLIEETGNPGIYSLWVQFDSLSTAADLEYKFFNAPNADPNVNGWEELPGGNRRVRPSGEEPDNLPPPNGNEYGEIFVPVVYFADAGPDDILTQDVEVIFQVEINPLIDRLEEVGFVYDVQTGDTIYSVESIQVAGPLPYLNNWPWGGFEPEYFLNDNGADGDLTAGDNVWAGTITMVAGTQRDIIYKYGCNQLDAEAGFARNHLAHLDDSETTYRMTIDCWGSPDVLFQQWPCTISDVNDNGAPTISDFSLAQNYPNPFNPTTTISFTLNRADLTSLNVFDVLGRTVATMNMGLMEAGSHTISFDGSNLSSGVYFYQLESGAVNATRKMLLLK